MPSFPSILTQSEPRVWIITMTKAVILPKWIQVCINQLLNPFTTFSDENQQKIRQNKQIFRPNKAKYNNISYSLILAALVNATGGMGPITYGSTNQDRFSIPCGQSHSTMALGTRLGGRHEWLQRWPPSYRSSSLRVHSGHTILVPRPKLGRPSQWPWVHPRSQGLSAARVLPRPWDTPNRNCKKTCTNF